MLLNKAVLGLSLILFAPTIILAQDPIVPPFTVQSLHKVDYDSNSNKHKLAGPTFGSFRLTVDGRIGYEGNSDRFVVISPEKYQANHNVPFMLAPQNSDFLSQTKFVDVEDRPILHQHERDRYDELNALKKAKKWSEYTPLVEQTFQENSPTVWEG